MANLILDTSQPARRDSKPNWTARTLWAVGAVLSIGLALFSYRYLPGLAFGAPSILGNALSRPFLYVHVAGAATALLIAPVQLIPALRREGRPWHRWFGRIYVAACLMGGIGGFIAAFGSTAGPIAISGFATLAVLWIFVNAAGWLRATQRRFVEHRRWMIYSFAMTFAAVTLRLYLPIFPILHLPFVDGYRAAAWVSWVGNLIVAQVYLRATMARSASGVAVAQPVKT